MTANPYGGHVAERVLGADPVELVVMLYEELLHSVEEARRQLAAGDAHARARAVSHALGILAELVESVDARAGGELAGNLLRLYAFLIERLQQGNFEQRDEPLAECERVILPLVEAWRTVCRDRWSSPPAVDPAALQNAPAVSVCG